MHKVNIQMIWNKFMILTCLIIVVTGCGTQTANTVVERKDAPVNYEIVRPPYGQEIAAVANSLRLEGGVKSFQIGKDTYVVIALGQRPSAGYTIALHSVLKDDGQVVIRYSEKKPEGMAASVITYPCMVIRLTSLQLPIRVEKV